MVIDLENGCFVIDIVVLMAVVFLVFIYSLDMVYCFGVLLLLQVNIDMFVWFFWLDGFVGYLFLVDSVGVYLFIVDYQGCVDSVVINVILGECSIFIFIFMAFLFNNDGINDVFEVYGLDVEICWLCIFDWWGGVFFD